LNKVEKNMVSKHHGSVLSFYKYFKPSEYPLILRHAEQCVNKLVEFQEDVTNRLHLMGCVLISSEGINGTLSGVDTTAISTYIREMESFDLSLEVKQLAEAPEDYHIFGQIDWKKEIIERGHKQPFHE